MTSLYRSFSDITSMDRRATSQRPPPILHQNKSDVLIYTPYNEPNLETCKKTPYLASSGHIGTRSHREAHDSGMGRKRPIMSALSISVLVDIRVIMHGVPTDVSCVGGPEAISGVAQFAMTLFKSARSLLGLPTFAFLASVLHLRVSLYFASYSVLSMREFGIQPAR